MEISETDCQLCMILLYLFMLLRLRFLGFVHSIFSLLEPITPEQILDSAIRTERKASKTKTRSSGFGSNKNSR